MGTSTRTGTGQPPMRAGVNRPCSMAHAATASNAGLPDERVTATRSALPSRVIRNVSVTGD